MFAIIFESVGVGEWLVLLAVLLVVVGPKNLPSTARKFGQHYAKFRRAAESFKRQLMDMDTEFNNAVNAAEREAANAFESEGDESTAEPSSDASSDDPSSYYPEADRAAYGEAIEPEEPEPSAEPAAEAEKPVEPAAPAAGAAEEVKEDGPDAH